MARFLTMPKYLEHTKRVQSTRRLDLPLIVGWVISDMAAIVDKRVDV